MADFTLSQSMIKSFWKYQEGKECGIWFKEMFINKTITSSPSDAMKLGIWFEFLCTGQRPKDGHTPIPERTKKGELTAAYKIVEQQAKQFKKYCELMGIEILEVGTRIEKEDFEGTFDIIANYKGRKVIIDLKFSSKLEDKWGDDGWELESLDFHPRRKERMCLQARAYMHLSSLPFYYFVFSSTESEDCKFFPVIVDPDDKEIFKAEIEKIRGEIEWELFQGFKPRPALKRCKKCPLFSTCEHKTEAPIEEEPIYYTKTA